MENSAKKSQSADFSDDDKEDLRAAYQAVPQMIAQESEKQWSATSVFIQLSIALVAAALTPSFISDLPLTAGSIFALAISILGLIASIVWLSFMLRYEKIVYFWILTAREIEEKMSHQLRAFQKGKDFAHGKEVTVSNEKFGYKKLERLPVRYGLFFTYGIFILIYLSLVVLNLLRLLGYLAK